MVKLREHAWALLGLTCFSKNKFAQNIKFNSGIPYATFNVLRCNFAMLLKKENTKIKYFLQIFMLVFILIGFL